MFYDDLQKWQGAPYSCSKGINLYYPVHLHNCYELLLLTEGQLYAKVDDREYWMEKDDILLIFPHQVHSYETRGQCAYRTCGFLGSMVEYFHQKHKDTFPVDPMLRLPEHLIGPYLELARCSSPCQVRGTLYNICGLFDDHTEYAPMATNRKHRLLSMVLGYIEEHYTESCSLAELASSISYDYSYLSRYITQQLGMPFTECVNLRRLNRARNLLWETDKSILEISSLCGFGSLRNFNRAFHALYGMTPQKFRDG